MKKISAILLVFCGISAFAQKHSQSDYILQQGDTLHGSVRFNEMAATPEKCIFQANGQPEVVLYPDNLKGFGLHDKHFRTIKYKGPARFAEVIVDGKAVLLRVGAQYFIQKDTAIVPLFTTTKQVTINGHDYTKEDKAYVIRLKEIFSDCATLPTSYEKTELWTLSPTTVEKKFAKVVSQYNVCVDSAKISYKKAKRYATFGVTLGAASLPFAAKGNELTVQSLKSKSPIAPLGGVFIDIVHPRDEHWHARLEASYFRVAVEQAYPVSYDPEGQIKLSFNALKVPVSLAYHFNTGRKLSPFVRGGASFLFFHKRNFVQVIHYFHSVQEQKVMDLANTTTTFFRGIGVEQQSTKKHSFFAELRYESGFNILGNSPGSKLTIHNMNLTAGVRF